jgi:hypothetical protein
MNEDHIMVAADLKNRLQKVVRMINFRLIESPEEKNTEQASDMDVFILVDRLNQEVKDKVSDTVWDVGADHNISITYWIAPQEDAESLEVQKILKEGILIK